MEEDADNTALSFFFIIALLVSFPAPVCFLAVVTLFLEFWKRYQAELEYEWDTVEFLEQEEPPRPEYEAKCIYERKNPITGVNHTNNLFPVVFLQQ